MPPPNDALAIAAIEMALRSVHTHAIAAYIGCPAVLEDILRSIQDTETRLERIPRAMPVRCEWPYVQVGNECRLP